MGEVLGREIAHQLLGGEKNTSSLKLMTTDGSPCPKARRSSVVPKHYHDLIGEHSAHPGVGLGPKAIKRKALAIA
jgi:DNA (cytosine-5)-methyltransferase 1